MIEVDAPKIKEVEKRLGLLWSQARPVLARAVNRAAENAKTNMNRKVREQYLVKARDVNKTVSIRKANHVSLGAVVKSKGFKIPLIKFKVSPKKPKPKNPPSAYKAQVKKGGGLKPVLGAFVANINGPKMMQRIGKKRLPIQQLFGPSVPEMIGAPSVIGYIEKEALSTLEKRIDHEIKRLLEGKK